MLGWASSLPTRASSMNMQLSPLFTWLRGELSTVAAETGFLVKRFDDADEPDVTSFEVKGVFRLLFGK